MSSLWRSYMALSRKQRLFVRRVLYCATLALFCSLTAAFRLCVHAQLGVFGMASSLAGLYFTENYLDASGREAHAPVTRSLPSAALLTTHARNARTMRMPTGHCAAARRALSRRSSAFVGAKCRRRA